MDLQHKIEVNFAKFLWHPRLVKSHSQSSQLVSGGQSWSKWEDSNQFSVINQWYDAQSKGLEYVLEYEKSFLVVVFLFIGNPSYLMYGRIGLYCSWLWLTLFIDNDKQRIMYRHEGEEQRPVCHVSARTIWEDCPSVCCYHLRSRPDNRVSTCLVTIYISTILKDFTLWKILDKRCYEDIKQASWKIRLMSSLVLQFLVFSLATINLVMGVILLDQKHWRE